LAMAWELQLEEYWGYYLAAYSSNPPMTFVDYLEKVVRNLREEGRKRELKKAMALPPDHPDREALIAEYSRPVICEYETAISPYMDIDYGLRRRIGRLKLRGAAEEEFDALSHSPTAVAPIIPLTEAARMPSFVQFVPEVDGVVRRFPMLMVHLPPEDLLAGKRGTLYPSLGLAICMDLLGVRFEDIVVRPGKEILLPGARDPRTGRRFDLSIPIDEHGRMFINWVAPWVDENDLPHVSLGDLLERDNETGRLTETAIKRAALFRDKIAIIGLTGTGTHDMNPIPLQARYPLVGAHGNVINTILTGRFIRQVPAALNAALVLGVTLLLGLALTRLERLWALAGFVILAAAYFATAYAAFAFGGLVVDVAHAEGALLCTSLGMFVYRYMTEERRRRQYRGVLQYYLAPDVVEEQLKDPDSIRLGGQKREVTALFSDIEKFSTISEKVGDPEKLVKLMSHYFDVACAPMWNRKAVIDKFIGDAIVAFWNAPKALPDHALQACLAALETKRAEASLEPLVREFGLPFPLRTRIGINTGEVTVGNMGSPTKFNYTILGDAANLASRLEGANKAFRTYIMIGESTYEQAKDGIEAREVDRVVVVGKTQPIRVYELLGAKGELREPWPEVLELFAKARTAYLKREFEKAAGLFAMILDKVPGDGPSEVYLQRCRVYMMKAPPPDWDGTTKLTEK
ncbi:MAG: adenylate/guanylate cyclase domain-containing protein, partial [Planctomycetota bacterium]|nr:adenylate/guanylate cyclase domain-containing protein [Planctomycetota bacterium]